MVAFILVCLVLLLGLLWGWEIRKRKSLEQEFVKKKNGKHSASCVFLSKL